MRDVRPIVFDSGLLEMGVIVVDVLEKSIAGIFAVWCAIVALIVVYVDIALIVAVDAGADLTQVLTICAPRALENLPNIFTFVFVLIVFDGDIGDILAEKKEK